MWLGLNGIRLGTINYNCGCKITRATFGAREVVSLSACESHRRDVQLLGMLERTARRISDLAVSSVPHVPEKPE